MFTHFRFFNLGFERDWWWELVNAVMHLGAAIKCREWAEGEVLG
jgi:hypothetical protein